MDALNAVGVAAESTGGGMRCLIRQPRFKGLYPARRIPRNARRPAAGPRMWHGHRVRLNRSDDIPPAKPPLYRKLNIEIIVRDSNVLITEDAFPVKGRHRQPVKTLNVGLSRGAILGGNESRENRRR